MAWKPKIVNQIEVVLPRDENNLITNNFVKALELSIYKKDIQEISFNLNYYSSLNELNKILETKTPFSLSTFVENSIASKQSCPVL